MEVRTKRRLSLAVIHMFMFVSGLEYAIIFPTIWEYLQYLGVKKEQTFWLGLVISAMTMTDMVSGLIIGRIVDVYYNIRLLVLGLNLFQVAGGILYAVAPGPLVLFLARLLSGCGKSISVAFLADLCKSTSKEERTPVLLLLNISYQVGLLLGPAMNLVLEHLNIQISTFTITKLNSPGLVMGLLWFLITILVLLCYSDLVKLASEELLSDQLDQGYLSSDTMENIDLYEDDASQSSRHGFHLSDDEAPCEGPEIEFFQHCTDHLDETVIIEHHKDGDVTENDADTENEPEDGDDNVQTVDLNKTLEYHDIVNITVTEEHAETHNEDQDDDKSDEDEEKETLQHLLLTPPPGIEGASTSNLLSIPAIDCFKARSRGGSGPDFSVGPPSSSQGSGYGSTEQIVAHSFQSGCSVASSASVRGRWDARVDPVHLLRRGKRKSEKYIIEAERMIADGVGFSEAEISFRTNVSSRNVSVIHSEAESVSITWTEYCRYILRIEIVILIIIRFLVLFCQTSLEAIVPPLMNTYFKFDDLANSYLYLAAAVEFIVVFGVLTAVARCVSDRSLVLTGLVLSVVALVWHSCTIPNFTIGDRSQVKYFCVGAFLQLLGCPVVAEIGLALYSKLLPETVQGFGHGVRRFFSQLAVLLGPLWGPSLLSLPLLMTLVPLSLQLLATLLFLAWYRRMIPRSYESIDENTPLIN